MNNIKNVVECLLYVSSSPLSLKKLVEIIQEAEEEEILSSIDELREEYDRADKPVFIQKVAGGWRMATKNRYAKWIKRLYSGEMVHRLSQAALETLAIIAYRQPVTTQEVDQIRGVSSGGVLKGLLEKKLIKIAGRKETLGRPILYRTTDEFLEYFGLESISDIPPLEEMGIGNDVQELINERVEKEN